MKIKARIIAVCGFVALMVSMLPGVVYADSEFSVTPMNQKVILVPGEKYEGSFDIANPVSNTEAFYYKLGVEPFYVDEADSVIFENNGDYNQIVNWITLKNATGSVEPNDSSTVWFTIDVPEDAPAGGQYAMIRVSSNYDTVPVSDSLNIENIVSIAHLVYAEVTGETLRSGEILNTDLPSFLLSGNITGASEIKNTGNVHGTAHYTLQVFPLFSNEEIYTNEEDPDTATILPDRKVYRETAWADTPPVGIFNVVYTVEFEGVTQQVKKMVIKCPIWLLFIIIFAIVALIIWLILRARNHGNKRRTEA